MFPQRGVVLRYIEFQVGSSHYHTGPVRPVADFIGLQTNFWILSHPLNLFAEGRKDVDAIRLVRKRNRHHIRLIVQRTSQPADRYTLQHFAAFLLGYGNDSHVKMSPDAAASLDYGVLFASGH